jgi:hypothetical protein
MTESQRRLVFAMFLYTCIEGLVVNFFYPNPIAYLPKDIMIVALYLGMMGRTSQSGSIAKFTMPFIFFAIVCLMFVAMPTPVSPMGMAVALKQRLLYIPLMFAGYHYLRGDADLARLLRVIAWSSIPVSLFGIFLFFAGPSWLPSLGADYSHVFFSTVGAGGQDFYRVPGTFNSPGQYGLYLYVVSSLLVGFLLVGALSPRDRRMILLALSCLVPAMLVSGSRTPLLLFLVQSGLIAMMTRQLSRGGLAAGIGYLVVVLSLEFLGVGVADRMTSTISWENYNRFVGTFFGQLWLTALWNNPVGEGLAVATIGARHFSTSGVKLVESYLGILSTEMGIMGVAAFAGLILPIGLFLARSRAWMRNAPAHPIWVAFFLHIVFTMLLTSNGTAIDAIPGNLYFWFFIGVAVKMVDLERTRLMFDKVGGEPGRASSG